ncbi:MAG: hypothetical protein PHE51_04880 [Eubacteriales bacterium]|nr:hypothetical protein [Eubacteriales bacterium]
MSITIEGTGKRGRKRKEPFEVGKMSEVVEKYREELLPEEIKLFWRDPVNFESIKKVCLKYGRSYKDVPDNEKAGIINLIKTQGV